MPEASRKTHGRNQPSSDVVAPNSGVQTYGMAPHLGRSQAKACPRPENLDTELAAGPSYRLCSACCDGHNSPPLFCDSAGKYKRSLVQPPSESS